MVGGIGVSIISFLPDFFLPGGTQRIAKEIHGMGVQLLPLRGLTSTNIKLFNVMSFEGPWNHGSVLDACKRAIGLQDNGIAYPSLIDIALFGSEGGCRKRLRMIRSLCPHALAIDIPEDPNSLIELSSKMHQGKARQWKGAAPAGIVLDSEHWKQVDARTELLLHLGGYPKVRMVHLKFLTSSEITDFIQGTGEIIDFLKVIRENTQRHVPVIIEIHPRLLVGKVKGDIIRKIRDRIRLVMIKSTLR